MLTRNIRAILQWNRDERYVGYGTYEVDEAKGIFKQDSYLKLDNGIWDQVSATFPGHNIALSTYGPYFQSAPEMKCMSSKGKPGFYVLGIADPFDYQIPPSVVLPNVVTGVLSTDLKTDVYFIFPYFDEVISNDAIIGNGNPDEKDEYINVLEARKKLLKLTDGRYTPLFQQALDVTHELNELQLKCPEETLFGSHILFAFKDGKAQLLLDPSNLKFDIKKNMSDAHELYDAYDIVIHKMSARPPVDLSVDYDTSQTGALALQGGESKEVVSYDLPEWKARSKDEEEKIKKLLQVAVKFVNDNTADPGVNWRVIDNYHNALDKLMALICFGHGEEIYDSVAPETKDRDIYLENLNETVYELGVKYYKQIPYDRINLGDLSRYFYRSNASSYTVFADLNLTDPNLYERTYRLERAKNTAFTQFHPTNPPEDPMYTLEGIYKVSPESKYVDFNKKRDEYELQVEPIPHTIVRINGIQFRSADLRIFYNTQFYDLVSFISKESSNVEIKYVSLKDLKLVRDLLEGRIMVQTFRDSLSPQGVVFFGGDRTFYQLSQATLPLLSLNSVFSFGKRFTEQLRNKDDMYLIETEFPRWEEFLEMFQR